MKVIGEVGLRETVEIITSFYPHGGGLAVTGMSDEGPYTFSVNLYGHPSADVGELADDEFVLNHDLLSDWFAPGLKKLLGSGLFEDTGRRCSYGFCQDIPIWRVK